MRYIQNHFPFSHGIAHNTMQIPCALVTQVDQVYTQSQVFLGNSKQQLPSKSQ